METAALVMQRLARLASSLLTGAQSPEILSSFWNDVAIQPKHESDRR